MTKQNLPANPLQSLLSRAAKSLPATTGETDPYRKRFDAAGTETVILCDTSSSMSETAGHRSKFEMLAEALASVVPDLDRPHIISFSSIALVVPSADRIPSPSGGTALHLGVDLATDLRPRHTLIISDGRPDDEDSALRAADRLPGRIDVIYCGPDSDTVAIAFMRRLARIGGGTVVVCDVVRDSRQSLSHAARQALGLPAPTR